VSEAFKKTSRLLEKADYGRVFKVGHRHHGKHFLVIFCANDIAEARLGIAVSRKVSPRAVVRNRIKRQIRETFRLNKSLLRGYDCVVVAKNAAAKIDQPDLRSLLQQHWQKISENA